MRPTPRGHNPGRERRYVIDSWTTYLCVPIPDSGTTFASDQVCGARSDEAMRYASSHGQVCGQAVSLRRAREFGDAQGGDRVAPAGADPRIAKGVVRQVTHDLLLGWDKATRGERSSDAVDLAH